jgi:CDP-diacylglycerol--glycerol-3-phosphate 3-phosphatidyltransferase
MTLVSIISAVDYFAAFWRKIDRTSTLHRQPTILTRTKPSPPPPVSTPS